MKNYFDHVIGQNPDVDVEEMNKSDSKSKYVHVRCTIPLNIETTDFWNTKRNKNNAKLFNRRECNNCWEAQPNRPLLPSRRLNNDHYIKTFFSFVDIMIITVIKF